MPQVNIPVASDWLVAGAARAQSGRRSRRHCCLPQLSVLSFHVCCSCWRRWKALWVMLRAGWTFLRLGSPIRDRPHSPKYACRGSGGQEAETTGGGGWEEIDMGWRRGGGEAERKKNWCENWLDVFERQRLSLTVLWMLQKKKKKCFISESCCL